MGALIRRIGGTVLTDAEVKQAATTGKDYKKPDGGGLYLFVAASGRKTWRFKYRQGGKEKRVVIGPYPDIKITQARAKRDEIKTQLRSGQDPKLEAQRARLVNESLATETFEKFGRQWFEAQKSRWKPVHANDVITSLEKNLFLTIGKYPIHEIDEPLLLSALKAVEDRGAKETARRLRQRAERIFKYARAHGAAAKTNPAIDVREAMAALPRKARWPAIIDIEKLRLLVRDTDRAGASPITRLAARFLGLTAQRPGMVRGLEWIEIEGVNWERADLPTSKALWRVPSERMKLEFDARGDDQWDHLVPLAPQAVEVLRAARILTGNGPLAFPNNRDAHTPLSENSIGYLYNRIGYKRVHVPHGWRSSFSTTMNSLAERAQPGADRLIIDRLIIDLMLAHVSSRNERGGVHLQPVGLSRPSTRDRRRLGQPPPKGCWLGRRHPYRTAAFRSTLTRSVATRGRWGRWRCSWDARVPVAPRETECLKWSDAMCCAKASSST